MEIDWWTMALQTINFLVVVWLLGRFLYRPVRRMVETREAADRAGADAAARKMQEAEALREEYARKLAAFEEEMRKRDAEMHEALKRDREDILSAARADAEQIRATARDDIEKNRQNVLTDLQGEIAALARDLATTALSEALADPVKALREELNGQPDEDHARIVSDLATGGAARIVTADALTNAQQDRMRGLLTDRVPGCGPVAFETDPTLIGGVVLHLPHAVLDLSVAGQLDRAARAMSEGDDDA